MVLCTIPTDVVEITSIEILNIISIAAVETMMLFMQKYGSSSKEWTTDQGILMKGHITVLSSLWWRMSQVDFDPI